MQCVFPNPLTEDQLTDALDGIANSSVQAHLAHCPCCSMRLSEARRIELGMRRALAQWDSPSLDELADYVMDMLDDMARRRIEAYLNTSPSAREEVKELRAFLGLDFK